MNLVNLNGIVLSLGVLSLPIYDQLSPQKPVQTSESTVNYAAPPTTLQGLASLSSAVILGRVVGSRTEAEWENVGYNVFTDYTVNITDVLKNHPQLPALGTDVTIRRLGGDFDAGDRIIRGVEHDFPQFSTGEVFLLFLHWNQVRSTFEVRSGPNGAYRISSGKLEPRGRSAVATRQNGRSLEAVLAELRTTVPN
jgi:hypothetical protein